MTSQSNDDNYSSNREPDQDDDDLLKNLVPDPNGECKAEDILAALDDYGPSSRRSNEVIRLAPDRSNEITSPTAERSNEVIATTARSSSNKITRRLRRSDSKDRQIIDGIRKSVMARDIDGKLALVGDFHTSILNTSWEHTGDRVKLAFANEVLALYEDDDNKESGARPVSWSLNLGPERLTEALNHPNRFVSCLSRLINRALRSRLGHIPFYWFMVDIEKDRLHLHGGMLASPDQLATIEESMRHAGGKWSAGPRSREKHQFHYNSERCDYGWIAYAIERKAQVKRVIGRNTFFIGKSLRKEAGSLYDKYRQILRGEADDV
jgi:hypothetical protein